MPAYVNITDGKTADNQVAMDIPLLKGSMVVAYRFYNDFSLLNVSGSNKVNFVIRHKSFRAIREQELPEKRYQHVLVDQIVELTEKQSKA